MNLQTVQKWLAGAVGRRNKWRDEAKTAYDFVAGEQYKPEDKQQLEDAGRPTPVFNRIAPIVDAIVGHETANRQAVAYLPRQVGATSVAETISAAARWVRDECGAEGEESDAFEDCVITGEGWTDTRIEYEEDPDGKILIERIDPREMDVDPSAQKKNYADAKWVCRTRKMDRDRAREKWPNGEFESAGRTPNDEPIDVIAAAFYHSDSGSDGRAGAEVDQVLIHDFQWWELENIYRVPAQVFQANPQLALAIAQTMPDAKPSETGMSTFTESQWSVVKDQLPGVQPTQQKRRTYKRMFWSANEVLEEKATPTGTSFTYKAITAKRDRKKRSWYGLVRAMTDPQCWSNKFMSLFLENLATSAKGGIIAELDAFENPRIAEDDWADPSKIVYAKQGAIAAKKFMPRPSSTMPPGSVDLMMYANQSLNDTAGVNPAVMGFSKELDVSGVLEQTRLQAGLNLLSYLFDSLRRYRKEQGIILMVMIREYIPQGRLVKIEGPEGAQYVPLVFDPAIAKYDIVVDEAPTAPNVKTQTWETFVSLAPHLPPQFFTPQFMLPLLKYSPFPSGLVQEWTKAAAQPDPQQQQMQQAMLGQAMGKARELNAAADLKQAEAADIGRTDPTEILSKVMGLKTEQVKAGAAQIKAQAEVTKAHAQAHQTHLDTQSAVLHHHLDTQAAVRDAALAEHQAQVAAQNPQGNA